MQTDLNIWHRVTLGGRTYPASQALRAVQLLHLMKRIVGPMEGTGYKLQSSLDRGASHVIGLKTNPSSDVQVDFDEARLA